MFKQIVTATLFIILAVSSAQTETGVKPEEFATSMRTAGYGIFAVNGSGIGGQVQVAESAESGTNIIVTLDGIELGNRYTLKLFQGDCGPDRPLLANLLPVPSIAGDMRASFTETNFTFEQVAEANNFLYVYNPDGSIAACGEVGLGALKQ